ncbi:MAG TPA: class I SAM-dependent methyltransferase [Nocardioidaceae bacterium]|nr:class I SAM-dependent methyltransferase [Nocardioidaceae bacterium]
MTVTAAPPGRVDDRGIVVPLTATGPVTVSFDGQHVWSFRPALDGTLRSRGWFVPWPAMLVPYLDGTTRVNAIGFSDGHVYVDEEVRLGSGTRRIAVRDRNGFPLAVNKVGTLSRAFLATDAVAREAILVGTARILSDLHGAGVAAYLNYGALLGAVREGVMIGHDCDTDVCYLSEQESPADVILESYRIERAMRARGWWTTRMSGGDFKVALELPDGRREQVDVFVAFYVYGRFYQLGNRSGTLARDVVLPLGTVELEDVAFPAPAKPEAMLEFLYGPSWRTPDPSFRYLDPPDGVRRLDGWLRGFRTEQPRWHRWYVAHGRTVPRSRSPFARWARARLPRNAVVADLGCGLGRDSVFFAAKGHRVLSFDCAPEARSRTAQRLRARGLPADVRRLQLNELRTVLTAGAELALEPGPVALYARQLLGCVDDEARLNFWRLAQMAGGDVLLELSTGEGPALPEGLVHRLDADEVLRLAERFGGRLVDRVDGPGTDMFDHPDHQVTRLHLTFAKESYV